MNAAVHWSTIGAMILCGLGMGTVFDIYRAAAARLRFRRWLLPLIDLLYWIAATLIVFRILLGVNYGEVRLYVFLGIGIGVTAYFGLFSAQVLRAAGWIFEALRRLGLLIWRTVRALFIVPVLWIVRMLASLLDAVFVVTAAVLIWIIKLLLRPLGPPGRWLWDRLLPVRRQFQRARHMFQRAVERVKEVWRVLRGPEVPDRPDKPDPPDRDD
ncbi:spore cortex biosynthesis protein YabQ [Cohnella sp. JJ-181]|uniref:spore cortex biosynthesis protein YabQ n=1 Tax=Cohnella rhizoplanae TaxID=2974897 RepID=UPI0022FF83D8|nr:spore cortex biosynthesis protein YabQ [Cohnella sp. JJ-181]CAI6084690.1 Spore protein YabQ [Cohnella sp. JJ-181]